MLSPVGCTQGAWRSPPATPPPTQGRLRPKFVDFFTIFWGFFVIFRDFSRFLVISFDFLHCCEISRDVSYFCRDASSFFAFFRNIFVIFHDFCDFLRYVCNFWQLFCKFARGVDAFSPCDWWSCRNVLNIILYFVFRQKQRSLSVFGIQTCFCWQVEAEVVLLM